MSNKFMDDIKKNKSRINLNSFLIGINALAIIAVFIFAVLK